jgi:hexosaminidase
MSLPQALLLFAAVLPHVSAGLSVLPLPTSLLSTPGCLQLSPSFSFSPAGAGAEDAYLASALQRSRRALASAASRGEAVDECSGSTAALSQLTVQVNSVRSAAHPSLQDDESYSLAVSGAAGGALLNASSLWGALRGLETFAQLLASARGGSALFIPALTVAIADAPRFRHRGLMIDTGRGFLPMGLLNATLDAMSSVKLNVLHWHISDDEAFPLQSTAWPGLTAGAMQAPSTSHVYSVADVAMVVQLAAERGIRVLPELDVPGHSTSWFAGYPELESQCQLPASASFSKPMDPTLDSTYSFLSALFAELHGRFPDSMLHIGGDEVEFGCWLNSSSIVAFMQAHNMTEPAQLQLYFEARTAGLLASDRTAVIWEENSGPESSYPPGAIVEVWKERHGDLSVMEQLIRAGYTVLYTTPDWYLDYPTLAAGFDNHVNGDGQWQFVHSVDPLANSSLSPEQQAQLLGGEVCMWSPFEDATNFMATVFPRAAAVAERLWSAAGPAVDEPAALLSRMRALRCRLLARGIGSASVEHAGSCPSTFAQAYVPAYA